MTAEAEEMTAIEAEEAVEEEEEEDEAKEAEVVEEPPWPMASTFQTSLGPSLTKNGELSQARAEDMSTKSATGSVAVPTKETQGKSPQPLL
jgi:hypothetical protein